VEVDFMKIQFLGLLIAALFLSIISANAALFATGNNASIVINEVMASNLNSKADPQGQYDDWIELYNFSDNVVDLNGMYLTDELSDPTKWQFPSGTAISAYGYLLIWADNDIADEGLHANFQLSSDGDEVGLFDVDGVTLLDSIVFTEQTMNISYGRYPDANDNFQYFNYPTPGSANTSGYLGYIEDLQISPKRGFYTNPISVAITTETEGTLIVYTLNGSDPVAYEDNGQLYVLIGNLYTGSLSISKTACLKAKAYKIGWQASLIETNTYIFVNDVIHQSPTGQRPDSDWPNSGVNGQTMDYGMDPDVINDSRYKDLIDDALLSIPTMSIVTDLANLFDPGAGIYVNADQESRAWERQTSLELINPDGSDGFQIYAGLRIRGGYSRQDSCPKHSFRFFFRSEYGQSKLKYALFGDEGADEFDVVDLATPQNFSWSFKSDTDDSPGSKNTFLRDPFARDLQREMGEPYARSRYYHLYINGQYWGLYYTEERTEKYYAQSYFGGDPGDYDVIKVDSGMGRPYTIEARDGTLDACHRLWDAAIGGFANNAAYYMVQGMNPDGTRNPEYERLVDIDNLIDYMIDVFYTGDRDSPLALNNTTRPNNYFTIYNRNNPDGFKFFRHDAEWTMLSLSDNRVSIVPTPGTNWLYFNPQWLHYQFLTNADYRMHFADHVQKYFFNNGVLTPAGATNLLNSRKVQIDMAIIAESARWGDAKAHPPRTKDSAWIPAVNFLLNDYFPSRTSTVLSQLKASGINLYPSVTAPTFRINGSSMYGGHIEATDLLSMTGDSGNKIFYSLDGTEPRDVYSSATVINTTIIPENASKKVIIPTSSSSPASDWKSNQSFNDITWIPGTGGVGYQTSTSSGFAPYINIDIKSQMYNLNASCYIRIPFTFSGNVSDFDTLTLKMRYDDGFVAYLNGTQVAKANAPTTIAWNSNASSSHDNSAAIKFESFDITSNISTLKSGQNLLAIQGLNSSKSNSDFLISVELVSSAKTGKYSGTMTLPKSTRVMARALSSTTWSALSDAVFAVGPVAENLRITEIMYHPLETGDIKDPNKEFIELKNIGSQTINLNLVKFTNGIDFTFPDVNLAPDKYIVVVKDTNAFASEYGTTLNVAGQYTGSLADEGERICLEDAAGQVIHDFSYKDGWKSITDGKGFSLTMIDPNITDVNSWSQSDYWRASALQGGSPGWDDGNIIPNPGSVVINEILAYSAAKTPDWIELYNTTGQYINIGGWYLSNSDSNLAKYKIAEGTVIAPGGYKVFYDSNSFDDTSDPGCLIPFDLNRNGDKVCLSSALLDVLTGYRETQDFGASQLGVSFGRYYKSSTGDYDFVAMNTTTPGYANSYPLTVPVVINEIMYNPSSGNQNQEYVELYNTGSNPVTLYNYEINAPWKFTDGIEYTFPADIPVTIPAGGYVIVAKSISAYTSAYGAALPWVRLLGPYDGQLSNSGEKVELSKPGESDGQGGYYYIRMDKVNYSDGVHPENCPGGVDLWPVEADGGGKTLSRKNVLEYGNDVSNWKAGAPSPGNSNP
jgi:hypothetical protein